MDRDLIEEAGWAALKAILTACDREIADDDAAFGGLSDVEAETVAEVLATLMQFAVEKLEVDHRVMVGAIGKTLVLLHERGYLPDSDDGALRIETIPLRGLVS